MKSTHHAVDYNQTKQLKIKADTKQSFHKGVTTKPGKTKVIESTRVEDSDGPFHDKKKISSATTKPRFGCNMLVL